MLTLDRLNKTYANDAHAVSEVSLQVREGELLALVGPSGCGKTTLLRLIAGLIAPDSGDIRMAGESVLEASPSRRNVSMVFQRPTLYPHLTVGQHLAEFEHGTTYAERLGVKSLVDRYPAELSGGEQQRVALARALARPVRLVLMDEPLSSLDVGHRLDARRFIQDVQRERKLTTVYVTHDQEEALSLGDRVAVLAGGVLQQIDMPTSLYLEPANRCVAVLLGSPPMQLLQGRLETKDGLCLMGISNRLTLTANVARAWRPYLNREVVVGIRPEQVSLAEIEPDLSVVEMSATRIEWGHPQPLVTFSREDWQVLTRMSADCCPQVGDVVKVGLRLRETYLFDARTGQALPPSG